MRLRTESRMKFDAAYPRSEFRCVRSDSLGRNLTDDLQLPMVYTRGPGKK
jgi:hypothetical protein